MYFRLALLLVVSLVLGCSFPSFREPPPTPKPVQFKDGATQCLTGATDTIKAYFGGTANETETIEFWDCVSRALNLFVQATEGTQQDVYSSRELANFLETYFLGGTKISDTFLIETMRFKQLLLGGKLESLTKKEFDQAQELLKTLKTMSLRLRPYMKIFSQNWVKEGSLDEQVKFFEAANVEIQIFAKAIGEIINKSQKSYELSNFTVFLKEFEKLYSGNWSFAPTVEKNLPIARKIKKVLAGGSEFVLESGQWKTFFLLGARGYVQYLRYSYFFKEYRGLNSNSIAYVGRSVDDLVSFVGDMVLEKPQRIITRSELLDILIAFSQFWPEVKYTDSLLVEIMKVKQLMFGGSVEAWTFDDLQKIREKIPVLSDITVKIIPYLDMYLGDAPPKSKEDFDAAVVVLKQTAEQFGGLLEGSYNLSDIVKLCHEFEILYGAQDSQISLCYQIQKYIPLIISFKGTFVGEPAESISAKDGKAFFKIVAILESRYLEYGYFYKQGMDEQFSAEVLGDVAKIFGSTRLDVDGVLNFANSVSVAIPGFVVSRDLLLYLFEFKQLIFGGDIKYLTSKDLISAQNKIKIIYDLMAIYEQDAEMYSLRWSSQGLSYEAVNERLLRFDSSLNLMSQLLQNLLVGEYNLDHLQGLVSELSNLYNLSWLATQWQQFSPYLNNVKTVKSQLVGEPAGSILIKDWPRLLSLIREVVGVYWRYHYTATFSDIPKGQDLTALRDLILKTSVVISHYLPFELSKFDKIILSLNETRLLPAGFKPETIHKILEILLNRFFVEPKVRLSGAKFIQLESSHLELILKEFDSWYQVQKFYDQIFTIVGDKPVKVTDFIAVWKKEYERNKPTFKSVRSEGLIQANRMLMSGYPLMYTEEGFAFLTPKVGDRYYVSNDLNELNWKRALAKMAIWAYSSNLKNATDYVGLTVEEFALLIKDITLIFPNLTATPEKFAASRFNDANLFTSRSNGNQLLDFEEGVEFSSLIFSGMKHSDSFRALILDKCGESGAYWKEKPLVDVKCSKEVLEKDFSKYYSGMPAMIDFESRLDKDFKEVFIMSLLKAGGYVEGTAMAELSVVSQSSHILQYVESIFIRFDLNADSALSTSESLKALPVFKKILMDVSGFKDNDDLEALLTYMLKYGQPPEKTFSGGVQFYWWKINRSSWDVWADRTKVIKIMAFISEAATKKAEHINLKTKLATKQSK